MKKQESMSIVDAMLKAQEGEQESTPKKYPLPKKDTEAAPIEKEVKKRTPRAKKVQAEKEVAPTEKVPVEKEVKKRTSRTTKTEKPAEVKTEEKPEAKKPVTIKPRTKKPVAPKAIVDDSLVKDKFPLTIDIEGTGILTRQPLTNGWDDLKVLLAEEKDVYIACYWTKADLKKFNYQKDYMVEKVPAKGFPFNLDITTPVFDCETMDKIYCASIYTEAVYYFFRDTFTREDDGFMYMNLMEVEVYTK